MCAVVDRRRGVGSVILSALVLLIGLVMLSSLVSAQPASLVGSRAPKVKASGVKGESVEIPAGGKATVVVFWNSRYRSSIDALGGVQRLWDTYRSRGLVCVGVNDMGEDAGLVKQMADQIGIGFPLITGSPASSAAASYKVRGVPVLFVVDKSGVVVLVKEGWDGGTEQEVSRKIASIM